MLSFLKSKPAMIVTGVLLLQTAVLVASIRPEVIPYSRPLVDIPPGFGSWRMIQDVPVESEVQEILKADDLLNRVYVKGNRPASLFVAGFKSQRTGKAPHSPKNCLPGSGWLPISSGEISIDVGSGQPISVNRYVISHGDDRSLVLYWYQSRDRVVADEFKAKFWVMMDAMRLNRTDTALVRVITPILDQDEASAQRDASEFVKSFYSTLRQYLPS